jgi:formate dehydrogenase major subunit
MERQGFSPHLLGVGRTSRWPGENRSSSWSADILVNLEKGEPVNHVEGIAHLGGATLDNEENYLIKKLFTGGLGMVRVSNQARI